MKSILIQLLCRYNSVEIAKKRLLKQKFDQVYGISLEFDKDLEKIHAITTQILDYDNPSISIVIPVYNEELEIIPTILTLLYGILDAKVPTEIIAVNNNSNDRSSDLLNKIGIKTVVCEEAGLRFARHAGVQASSKYAKYIWLIDADTRLLPPLKKGDILERFTNPLKVSYDYMEAHHNCVAVSTGIRFEYQILLRRFIKQLRLLIKGGNSFSCWTGPNQFIKKEHLLAIGGIDLEVDGGEDHHRVYQLVRYAKKHGLYLAGADLNPALYAPVYTSDRRNATVGKILKNIIQQYRKPKYAKDEYGLPIHPKGVRYKDLYRKERGSAKF